MRELASIDFLNFSLPQLHPLMSFGTIQLVKHTAHLMPKNRPFVCNDES